MSLRQYNEDILSQIPNIIQSDASALEYYLCLILFVFFRTDSHFTHGAFSDMY